MNTTPPPLPRSRLRRRISPACLVWLILIAIFAVPLTWHLVWRIGNARAVARLEKAAHERGEPINLKELAATYPEIPAVSNAYAALEAIWETEDPPTWKGFRETGHPFPGRIEPKLNPLLPVYNTGVEVTPSNDLSSESRQAMEDYLAKHKSHTDQVRAALKRPGFRARVRIEDGWSALLPYLPKMKEEANHFQLEALGATEAGETDRAVEAISTLARLGHCLDKDPFLVGRLTQIRCFGAAIAATERLMSRREVNEQQLAQLELILSELKTQSNLKEGYISDRASDWTLLESAKATQEAVEPGAGGRFNPYAIMELVGWTTADKRLMGETFEKLIQCAENPEYAANNQIHEIFVEMDARAKTFPPKLLTRMLMPALERAADRFASSEAIRRCAVTAVVVERYRLHHAGRISESLGELIEVPPGATTDPFTGEPMNIKHTAGGYLIYSVGPDREDDGGLVNVPEGNIRSRPADVGFRVERAGVR